MKKKLSALLLAVIAALGIYVRPKPPVPLPEPSPTPTATAAPTASPEPSSSVLPTPPLAYLCGLPETGGTGECIEKPITPSNFREMVSWAQKRAAENGFVKDGKVTNEDAYTNEVVRLIRVDGYCAINGRQGGHTSGDEAWVKDSNGFSEHMDIVSSDGSPILIYAARCVPAKF